MRLQKQQNSKNKPGARHLYAAGMAVGLPDEMLFDVKMPCCGCRICGEVFQSDVDRIRNKTALDVFAAITLQNQWRERHNKTHSSKQHLSLSKSGRWCTPEAAQKLSSYGIISLSDMILYDETEIALREVKAIPVDDVEGR
jgi:hypothetical protein